ncbi:hypothetical protein [Actinomycetospora cinnamomea]|uniref:Uncharacterized protein n=1 Tax=Actinomycetospora cinnamomea TaxID=663609 RepID=A0A2U1F7Y0_9PSEU|nr:hypothetical protein [Actinomycetospora cinnamomea]PVZ08278.1 hypothetical protein C8D89_109163 [Actinomycetospora cinnamomea]
MLHEPIDTTLAPPAATPDLTTTDLTTTDPARSTPEAPDDLRALARRARRDVTAARELAAALLARGWAARRAAALSGLAETAVAALGRVRRPGTAAGFVADDVAARARRRADAAHTAPSRT